MLLGDADVEHPFRMPCGELVQSHRNEHGAGNADEVRALVRDVGDLVGEDGSPRLCTAGIGGLAGLRIDDADRVELVSLVGAGLRVPVAFFGHGVHDHRTGVVLGGGQGVLHGLEVVSVHWPDVFQAEVLEHALRGPPVLDAFFMACRLR